MEFSFLRRIAFSTRPAPAGTDEQDRTLSLRVKPTLSLFLNKWLGNKGQIGNLGAST